MAALPLRPPSPVFRWEPTTWY